MEQSKTHYRKAFDSPYLSSEDITEATVLTITHVTLEADRTKKTKDSFNTAHFKEKELRPGEPLKPMILNATNSRTMAQLAGSKWIEDWTEIPVTIFVDNNIRFGRDTVSGLRISNQKPRQRQTVTPDNERLWNGAITAFQRDGNFDAVLKSADISKEHQNDIRELCGLGEANG